MNDENNSKKEQDEELKEMNYSSNEDIFSQEKPLSLDNDGEPLYSDEDEDTMEENLDVPGSEYDNESEEIGEEDEENNYYSLSDNEDDHEEENEDLEE